MMVMPCGQDAEPATKSERGSEKRRGGEERIRRGRVGWEKHGNDKKKKKEGSKKRKNERKKGRKKTTKGANRHTVE